MNPPEPFRSLDQRQFNTLVQGSETPSLIYLYDEQANLCQLIDPIVSKICTEKLKGINCFAIDVQENKDLTFELKVTRAPSFVYFHRGQEIRRLTRIDYDDEFETRLDIFLRGDFLFDDDSFNRLEEMNFFSNLKDWHQYNLVAFMQPTDPINWQLAPILSELYEDNANFLRLHLVDSTKNESLLSHYKIKNLPAVIFLEQSDEIRRWHPASNPEGIREECENFIADQRSDQRSK